eukprot:31142-Pelagococcus_subviridis.AAC.8
MWREVIERRRWCREKSVLNESRAPRERGRLGTGGDQNKRKRASVTLAFSRAAPPSRAGRSRRSTSSRSRGPARAPPPVARSTPRSSARRRRSDPSARGRRRRRRGGRASSPRVRSCSRSRPGRRRAHWSPYDRVRVVNADP